MILSVSRRTDIPACHWQWFLNRLDAGFLCVRNPFNPRQISRIDLDPRLVDCMVFWTKNPMNLEASADRLKEYVWYAQVTITGYGSDLEPGVPDKKKVVIPAFQELASRFSAQHVIWRYDPILINDKYSAAYHFHAFGQIARSLKGFTNRVMISFLDLYRKNEKAMRELGIEPVCRAEAVELASGLKEIAAANGMEIFSCAEKLDLTPGGVSAGACVDKRLIEELCGCQLEGNKDKNQRSQCGCLESVDAGIYDTCSMGCRYCYAGQRKKADDSCDVHSPLLQGQIGAGETVSLRKQASLKKEQMTIF